MEQITEQIEAQKIKAGDIFYTSWGYDQTNYDYIIVEKLSPTGKTAICRRAQYDHVGYESCCNVQKPIAKGFGKSFRMKIVGNELRGSYIFCGDADSDSKRFDYFSKAKDGQTFHETDSMFGH